jgi:hypothetical protein
MRRVIASVALVVLFAAVNVQAWWCTGHMVIAEIARQNLNPGIEDKVNMNFKYLMQWFKQSDNMISGACWADDLKSEKLEVMAGWHFINQPYNPDSVPIHPWPIQEINVETAIMKLSETLKSRDNDWITAYATANLIHFYGDIHQPLHATELFDADFPHGDYGGNAIPVFWQGQEWRLHFIWDSVCAQYSTEPTRPLSDSSYAYIKNLAAQYMANFSVPDSQKSVWNSTIMAQESWDAAVKYSYDNNRIKPNQTLTQEYIDTCKTVAGYRLAYAGYRLAQDLNYLFKDNKQPDGKVMLARLAESKEEFHRAVRDLRVRRN